MGCFSNCLSKFLPYWIVFIIIGIIAGVMIATGGIALPAILAALGLTAFWGGVVVAGIVIFGSSATVLLNCLISCSKKP